MKNGAGPIESLYIGEIEKPSPRHGEVLVKVCVRLRADIVRGVMLIGRSRDRLKPLG